MQQSIDPYEVLQLPKNFTLESLKSNYKKQALKLHPDRSNPMTTTMFQILTNAYKTLLKVHEARSLDKPHEQLKNQYQSFVETQQQQQFKNVKMSTNSHTQKHMLNGDKIKFDSDKFNRIFDENKLDDAYSEGYDAWLRSNASTSTQNENRHIVKYKQPEALPASSKHASQYYELGKSRVRDFSADNISQQQLNFMDLRTAHTTDRLADESYVAQRKSYKNIQELESDRAGVSFQLSEEDARRLHKQKIKEEKAEQERLQRLNERDAQVEQLYTRVNRLMLGGTGSR